MASVTAVTFAGNVGAVNGLAVTSRLYVGHVLTLLVFITMPRSVTGGIPCTNVVV